MRRHAWTTAITALLLAACGGPADENGSTAAGSAATNGATGTPTSMPEPTTAAQYVALASSGDLYEIESARLALQRATSPEVKGLAEMILADHQRSTRQLTAAATHASPPLALARAMSADQQTGMDLLRAANARAFDTTYLRQQVLAHQRALDMTIRYASAGDVPALRQHAAATIEPIQRHLTRARTLEAEALARP